MRHDNLPNPSTAAAARIGSDPLGADPRRAEAVRRQGLRRHLDARDRGRRQRQYRLDRLSFRRQGRAARGLRELHRRHHPGGRQPGLRGREQRAEGRGRGDRAAQRRAGAHGRLHRRADRRPARSCSSCCASWRIRPRRSTRIYNGVFEPTHARLCQIWADATGEDAESDRTKITVFTMIGQVVYFRIGREAVMRRMGWKTSARRRRQR